jgi:hypothetical protein
MHQMLSFRTSRSERGSQIAEFGAALVLLSLFLVLPLLDLLIVPIRWMMAQELINAYVRNLAMCETFSQSIQTMEADPSLRTRLIRLGGVEVQSMNLLIKVTRISQDPALVKSVEASKPGTIPTRWLPDGALAPCGYSLVIDVKAAISPGMLLRWEQASMPGITAPFPISVAAAHEWVNLGKDPATGKYFINE